MPIAFEGGRRGGSASFRHRGPCYAPAAAAAAASGGFSSSAGRGSDSRAAVLQCDEVEESDGEVQSSYRGPFDTMDALQDALPNDRRAVSKFYNGKSSSVVNVAKDLASPQNSSPKKRKGLLRFSFSWSKSRSKESLKNCRKTVSPALASCAQGNSRGDNERGCRQDPPRHSLQGRPNAMGVSASPPGAPGSQLIAVQMKSVSVAALEDVAESTASVSPREKRRKSLQ